jgi:hypothetical protein
MMRHIAVVILAELLAIALGGCAGNGSPASRASSPSAHTQPQIDPRILHEELTSFADRFCSAIVNAYDRLSDRATTTQAKDIALTRKVGIATAAISNAVQDNPVAGLLDMMVMARLTRESAQDPWFIEAFGGEEAAQVLAVHMRQEDEIWQIAEPYLSANQITELTESIDRWRRDHPDQRNVAWVRLSDFSRAKSASASKTRDPGSVFGLLFLDPFASLDPAVREVERSRETAERMFYYVQRMPMIIAGQAELASRRSLAAPQIGQFLADTSRFSDSTLKFADATGAIADSVTGFPKVLTDERQHAVEQLAQKVAEQRDAAIRQMATAVSTERDAAITQIATAFANERRAAIHQATTQATVESNAVIDRLDSLLRAQRTQLAHDTESLTARLINRIVWGQIIVILAAVIAAVVGALTYRRFRSRLGVP